MSNNQPAFPTTEANNDGSMLDANSMGISTCDYFAAKVLAGMIANGDWCHLSKSDTAKAAYKYADAMMEARKV